MVLERWFIDDNIDELVQERRNSANALELRLSCTKPSIWNVVFTCDEKSGGKSWWRNIQNYGAF